VRSLPLVHDARMPADGSSRAFAAGAAAIAAAPAGAKGLALDLHFFSTAVVSTAAAPAKGAKAVGKESKPAA
jgi:hypothetical protein